jgi:predicted metal-dependent HD superfamily phosphohydrolase
VRHLATVLDLLEELWPHPDRPVPPAVRAAAWFHDAVYEPTRGDNEARSAAWARRALGAGGVDRPVAEKVARLVEATAAHRLISDLVATPGAACFLDADLAVLGAEPAAYDRYARAIRVEYRHLDDEAFRRGRLAVLEGLTARPHLYLSARGRARFEAPARANLAREIAALGEPRRDVRSESGAGPAAPHILGDRQGLPDGDGFGERGARWRLSGGAGADRPPAGA